MILFVGYTNFVSVMHPGKKADIQPWIGKLDYSGLKLQMLGSVIAVASIRLLRTFLEVSEMSLSPNDRLMWYVVLYTCFLAAVLIMAIVNKLKSQMGHHDSGLGMS